MKPVVDPIALDISRVLDRRLAAEDYELNQLSENIHLFLKKDDKMPVVAEPTLLAGSWAKQLARTGRKTVLQALDEQTRRWLSEGKEGDDVKDTLFYAQPNVWIPETEIIVFRDVLWTLGNDKELAQFIEYLCLMVTNDDLLLLFDIKSPKLGKNAIEIMGINIIETYEKLRPRKLRHSLRVRDDDQGFKLDEEITTWAVSDVYSACKSAGFKPAQPNFGLDTSRFIAYKRS